MTDLYEHDAGSQAHDAVGGRRYYVDVAEIPAINRLLRVDLIRPIIKPQVIRSLANEREDVKEHAEGKSSDPHASDPVQKDARLHATAGLAFHLDQIATAFPGSVEEPTKGPPRIF